MESKDRAYHEKVRQGFLAMARERPDRFAVADASRPPQDVEQAVWAAVRHVL
jgi:dTMP kinase